MDPINTAPAWVALGSYLPCSGTLINWDKSSMGDQTALPTQVDSTMAAENVHIAIVALNGKSE